MRFPVAQTTFTAAIFSFIKVIKAFPSLFCFGLACALFQLDADGNN
jgi:ABC-type proline/glycine betaine transport system permease subunit